MSAKELFIKPLNDWMNGSGADSDIVLSSRVRLARNICGIPFPNRASLPQLAEAKAKIEGVMSALTDSTGHAFTSVAIDKLSMLERNVLIEKHLASYNLAANPENRALVISDDNKICIMVNEEDHLRIQCMVSGLDLAKAWAMAEGVDDVVEAKLEVAFNEKLGYLTSCPTNIGTGLRASVMVHLPGLVYTRRITKLINALTQLGLTVRGLYGEGTEVIGNIFQISNQLTLGFSEQEIIDNLTGAVMELIMHERAARKMLAEQSADVLADKIWRSFGILKYAQMITDNESLLLLSEVRMGVDIGVITEIPSLVFNELLVSGRVNYLQNLYDNGNLSQSEIDKYRAQMIRTTFAKYAKTVKE